jgi:hypothetical protein
MFSHEKKKIYHTKRGSWPCSFIEIINWTLGVIRYLRGTPELYLVKIKYFGGETYGWNETSAVRVFYMYMS